MCGFLGEYSFQFSLSQKHDFEALLYRSKHRGPDATKLYKGAYFQMGFNRLALLDLTSAGEQPKFSPSNRYVLVFNGEVYNYKELINTYHLQHLRSSSDTEVILHLLDAIGVEETFKVLNGMFAIAIIDTTSKKLYLCRDFAGIKPLFWGVNEKGIVFASQFDQVFQHPWFRENLRFNASIVKEYFSIGYMQAPNTVYDAIFQVLPGEYIEINADLQIQKKTFQQWGRDFKYNQPSSSLQTILSTAIAKQLNADRPLACFLSGGVDSSLITALAKQQKDDIEAFTFEVEDARFNEGEYAKVYATHLHVKHTLESVSPQLMQHQVDEHFLSFSEPFGDYSSLPTYLTTKAAAKEHTAMLSGDGADELFFGYPRMGDLMKIKKIWYKWPYWIRINAVRITNKLGLTNTYSPYFKSFGDLVLNRHSFLPQKLLNNCFLSVEYSKDLMDMYNFKDESDEVQTQHYLRWNEFYAHLQRILIKVDRTSMRNSLEVRVPFLDKEVIQWAWHQMYSITNFDNLKQPMKELVYNFIPKDIMMSKKKGFSIPLKDWLLLHLKEDLIQTVLQTSFYGEEIFNAQPLKDYVIDFLNGKHQNEWGVWHIYAWQKWAIQQKLVNS